MLMHFSVCTSLAHNLGLQLAPWQLELQRNVLEKLQLILVSIISKYNE
jgi:hypothetical protein